MTILEIDEFAKQDTNKDLNQVITKINWSTMTWFTEKRLWPIIFAYDSRSKSTFLCHLLSFLYYPAKKWIPKKKKNWPRSIWELEHANRNEPAKFDISVFGEINIWANITAKSMQMTQLLESSSLSKFNNSSNNMHNHIIKLIL